MKIDIRSLLSGKLSRLSFSYEIEENDEIYPLPPDDVQFLQPVFVEGFVTDNAGYMEVNATATINYKTRCARCLESISGKYTLNFNRIVVNLGTLQNEDDDNYTIVKNGFLDIDHDLVDDLVLEFPTLFLCKEECAGLCPKCGKNLNFGPCDCPKKKEIDPRFAILQKLLEKEEE